METVGTEKCQRFFHDGAGGNNDSSEASGKGKEFRYGWQGAQMNSATEAGLVALLTADRSVAADRIPLVIEVAKGRDPVPSNSHDIQTFLTTKEACDFFRCSRMTLHRAETDGQIHSVHLRGKKLFERTGLINALKSGKGRKCV